MAALSDKDLAVILGEGFVPGAAMLHEQFLKTVEPKPPASLTRTGAFLCIALAVVSLVGAIYQIATAAMAVYSNFSSDKIWYSKILDFLGLFLANPVVPIAAFSALACGVVLWSCMKVLQGFNTGSNRINCVLAMVTNSLIGSILVLFANFGQPLQSIILSAFAIASLVAIFAWFWQTTDCID
jgi:hypothetical protein